MLIVIQALPLKFLGHFNASSLLFFKSLLTKKELGKIAT